MNWVKIYFSRQLFKIVFHFLYILMCLLLLAKILAHYGIHYSYPEKIDMPVVLTFMFHGDVLIPMLSFLLFYILFDKINYGLNYFLYLLTRGRIPFFKRLKEGITKMAASLKWFEMVDGKYKRMQNYERFDAILQSFEELPTNVMDIAALFNSVILSSCLCLLLYPQGGVLRIYLLVFGVIFYFTHVFNLLFLRTVKSDIEFYRGIRREICRGEGSRLMFFKGGGRRRRRG